MRLFPTQRFTATANLAAGGTQIWSVPVPYGARIRKFRLASDAAVAQSGTAGNQTTARIRFGGTDLAIISTSNAASTYDPPRLNTALAANTPVTLDLERRPGIDYTKVDQGDRAEVAKATQYNQSIPVDGGEIELVVTVGGTGTATSYTVQVEWDEGYVGA